MNRGRKLFATLNAAGIVLACGDLRAQAPSVSCRFDGSAGGGTVSEAVVRTNLEPIRITVQIAGNMQLLDEPVLNAGEKSTGNVSIEAVRLDGSRRQPVGLRLSQSGINDTEVSRGLIVDVGVLVDSQRRAAAIKEFVERAERTATNSPEDQATLRTLRRDRELLVKSLEQLYSEHQVGLFEIRCAYTSSASGKWNGSQHAAPLYLRITDAGKFFDQIK